MGTVAKSYMRKGFLIYEEISKYLTIYEEAVSNIWLCNRSHLNFLIYEENLIFFVISVSQPDGDNLLSSFLTLCMWQEEGLPIKAGSSLYLLVLCWQDQGADLWGGWGRHPKISSGHHFSRSESVRYYSIRPARSAILASEKRVSFLAEQKQFLGTHFPPAFHHAWLLCHPTRMLGQI